MIGRGRKWRAASAAALVAAGVAVVASPSSVAAQAIAPYGGSASADLVHVTALEVPNVATVADVAVGPSSAEALSTGIGGGAARSAARATNVDLDLVSGQLPIPGLLVEATQTAPPNNAQPASQTLVPLPLDPVANVGVGTASAHARWISDSECVPPGTPIATSRSSLADVELLTLGTLFPIPGVTPDTALVSLVNGAGGTVFTETSTGLFSTTGTRAGVRSTALTQVTGLVLFKGIPGAETTINVLAPPVVTAQATGVAGGADVTYSQPVLQVIPPVGPAVTLDASTANQSFEIPALARIELGTLTKTVAADGTSASGQADLLRITLLTSPLPVTLADLSVAAASVSARVPAGGVNCDTSNPLRETHKDLSAVNVGPGQTFTYSVTVPNRGDCTLTNVSIVDQITGPAGASIVTTDPPGTVDGLKITWQVASIAPNETKTFQITVRAPDAVGGKFSNHVDATGTCDGRQVSQPADVDGPTVAGPTGQACRLSTSNKAASHTEVMPGQTFNYYIHAYNSGGQTCTDVTVTDTLEGPIDFVSCTDACRREGARLTWGLGNLAPGQSRTVAVTVRARPDAPQGQNLPDAARITSGRGGNGPSADVRTDGPTVSTRSVLAPPSPAGPGGPVAVTALPRTGANVPLAAGVLLAVGLAVTALRRRAATAS